MRDRDLYSGRNRDLCGGSVKTFDEAFTLIAPKKGTAKEDPDMFERLSRDLRHQTDECFMNRDFTCAILTAVRHLSIDLTSRQLDNPPANVPTILASHLSTMFVLGLRVGMEMEKAE